MEDKLKSYLKAMLDKGEENEQKLSEGAVGKSKDEGTICQLSQLAKQVLEPEHTAKHDYDREKLRRKRVLEDPWYRMTPLKQEHKPPLVIFPV